MRRMAASSSSHQAESANNSGMEAELPTWPVHLSQPPPVRLHRPLARPSAPEPPSSGVPESHGRHNAMVQHPSLSAQQRHKPGRQCGTPRSDCPLGSDLHGGGASPVGVAGTMCSSLISFSGMVVAAYAQTPCGAEKGSESHLRARRFFLRRR